MKIHWHDSFLKHQWEQQNNKESSEMRDTPNIDMMLKGCVSGPIGDWPVLIKEVNALRARIAQLEEALEHAERSHKFYDGDGLKWCAYCSDIAPHKSHCPFAALSTPPGEGTQGWLERVKREAKSEALEALPCYPCDDCGASDCKTMHEASDCPRCAALAELRQGGK
jgi:hypothetical protein